MPICVGRILQTSGLPLQNALQPYLALTRFGGSCHPISSFVVAAAIIASLFVALCKWAAHSIVSLLPCFEAPTQLAALFPG